MPPGSGTRGDGPCSSASARAADSVGSNRQNAEESFGWVRRSRPVPRWISTEQHPLHTLLIDRVSRSGNSFALRCAPSMPVGYSRLYSNAALNSRGARLSGHYRCGCWCFAVVRSLLVRIREPEQSSSANGRPMNSSPTGRPSTVNPAGTVIAGKPMTGLRRRLLPGPVESMEVRVKASDGIRRGGWSNVAYTSASIRWSAIPTSTACRSSPLANRSCR